MHLHRIRGAARHRVPRNHAISIVTENLLSPFAKNLLERFRDGSPIIGYGWGMLEPIRVSASGNLSQWGMDQARSPIRRPPKVTAVSRLLYYSSYFFFVYLYFMVTGAANWPQIITVWRELDSVVSHISSHFRYGPVTKTIPSLLEGVYEKCEHLRTK